MSESRSRSPYKDVPDDYYLFIGNLPTNWHHNQILQYLRCILEETYSSQIVFLHKIKHDGIFEGECVIEFLTDTACKTVADILVDKEVEGRKLEIVSNAKNRIPITQRVKRQRSRNRMERMAKEMKTGKKTDIQVFQNHETYGLSVKFLADLGIEPPLTNRVCVSLLSLKVTETKLREVFSYAGHVVAAFVVTTQAKKFGKVLFDHPVEAVQAISMFHNKELYNKCMYVTLDKTYKWKPTPTLPDGLASIGMGLGRNGDPMLSVRHNIELEPLKKLLSNELNKVQNNNPGLNQSNSNNPNQFQNNNQWNNNQMGENNQTNDNVGNAWNNLMQILQQNISGNLGSLGLGLQQAMCNQVKNQNAFGNVPDLSSFGVQNVANQAFGNQNVANQNAFANQNVANENAFGNQAAQPQSRFDVPPNALTLAQNAIVNQNDLVQQVQQLTYQQNASMWQTPQAPKSRFDIPPSAMTAQNVAAIASSNGQNWNSGNWCQTQTPSHASSYERSDSGFGGPKINSDGFDAPRLSDTEKSEKTSSMLFFTNLPSSVTSQALVNKMSEVGPLKFAEITGQGRAIVHFQHGRDADQCLELYDRSKVDGQVITVKIV